MASENVYDLIDTVLCYVILACVTLYALSVFIRDYVLLKQKFSLRTLILLVTFMNSLILSLYTVSARHCSIIAESILAQSIADTVCSIGGFMQFFLVVFWFVRAHEDVHTTEVCIFTRRQSRSFYHFMVFLVVLFSYIVTQTIVILRRDWDRFRRYHDYFTVVSSVILILYGIVYFLLVQLYTDPLNVPKQVYTVVRRSRYTCYLVAACSIFYVVLSWLSLRGNKYQSGFSLNVIESSNYVCHQSLCLVSLIVRTIVVVAFPNVAISFTFSSPSKCNDTNAFLCPLQQSSHQGKQQYTLLNQEETDESEV
ncbi:hypothetical protein MP228_006022 [Amoeboaphelidium protococcarum]|nr:hypothetical protein MP228_006022 [Amoeboaphelidium protococcarum]